MHTLTIKTNDFGNVSVIHHGDWCGEARVIWYVGDDKHEVELPASLLMVLGKEAAVDSLRSFVINAIEDWDPGKIEEP